MACASNTYIFGFITHQSYFLCYLSPLPVFLFTLIAPSCAAPKYLSGLAAATLITKKPESTHYFCFKYFELATWLYFTLKYKAGSILMFTVFLIERWCEEEEEE